MTRIIAVVITNVNAHGEIVGVRSSGIARLAYNGNVIDNANKNYMNP